ncbi:unnamed protein product [Dicrocoelium dendriticum]|nr:unnamed protein product [Dicrocoelium dendriticum]
MGHADDIESLTAQLVTGMDVGECGGVAVDNERGTHPRMSLYKNLGRAIDQERRWRSELAITNRKNKRQALIDCSRGLQIFGPQGGNKTDVSHPWASKASSFTGSSWRSFSRKLMLAEWLLFMPPEFATSYCMVPCPKGRHVLVCAAKAKTIVYSRTGAPLLELTSRLPGGGLGQSDNQNDTYSTLLDCIMLSSSAADPLTCESHEANTEVVVFKVLDLIQFRCTCYTHLPFHERSLWLRHYLRPQIEEYHENDPVRFEVLPSYACDTVSMNAVMSNACEYDVDGFLFYHQDVRYKPGATPLVGWLKPYMMPEWFPDLHVHESYMKDIPVDYTDYLNDVLIQEERGRRAKPTQRTTAVHTVQK